MGGQDQTSMPTPLADDLLIGAGPIAEYVFGDPKKRRDVYRNAAGLPLFRVGAQIAALKSSLRAEISRRDSAAHETLQQNKISEPSSRRQGGDRVGRLLRGGKRSVARTPDTRSVK